jgi:hypothetical protein
MHAILRLTSALMENNTISIKPWLHQVYKCVHRHYTTFWSHDVYMFICTYMHTYILHMNMHVSSRSYHRSSLAV